MQFGRGWRDYSTVHRLALGQPACGFHPVRRPQGFPSNYLLDLFISYLTLYNHAKWNLAFKKFSVYCHM